MKKQNENIVLQVDNVSVHYVQNHRVKRVLQDVSFSLHQGSILSLVGESGSGKSTIAKTVTGLLPPSAYVEKGSISIGTDFKADLCSCKIPWPQIRGKKIGFIFQDAQMALDPSMRIVDHFKEILLYHRMAQPNEVEQIVKRWLGILNFHDPETVLRSYPFQLSGGMCQRVYIAMTLCLEPSVLIADEPTSALDIVSQKEVLDLLQKIREELKLAIIFITHDIAVAYAISDSVIVLKDGEIVETGRTQKVFLSPGKEYTKQLLASRNLAGLQTLEAEYENNMLPALEVLSLGKNFGSNHVLKGIDLTLFPKKIVGILGESGCGKSTLAKCIIGLEKPDSGRILCQGQETHSLKNKDRRGLSRQMQMIFQDARASLSPRRTALQLVQEPLCYMRIGTKKEKEEQAKYYLDEVGISGDMQNRRPPQLSTGQCQRIAIARALILEPKVLICDEAVSALDMTVQAQILELLKKLHKQIGFSIIMISHDIRVLRFFCHHIAVMKDGAFCDIVNAEKELDQSEHEYVKKLLLNEKAIHI